MAVLTFHYRTYCEEGLPSLTTAESLNYFWTKLLQLTGFSSNADAPEDQKDPTMIPAVSVPFRNCLFIHVNVVIVLNYNVTVFTIRARMTGYHKFKSIKANFGM